MTSPTNSFPSGDFDSIISNQRGTPGERRKAIQSERIGGNKPASKRPKSWVDLAITVAAELLITFAVIAGLFFLWKFVILDAVTATQQSSSANQVIENFGVTEPAGAADFDPQNPPLSDSSVVPSAEKFGVLYIPRLDANYKRVVLQDTGSAVLDEGIGHYKGSQMPGQYGNFALAGHRNTVFANLKTVVPGDKIYVQTKDGYYTYEMKEEHSIVKPSDVSVIAPIANQAGSTVEDAKVAERKTLTLTTCWPEWSNTERLIVFAEFVEWQPLSAGAPAEIASVVGTS